MDFFAYGSLMFEEVMVAVTGHAYTGCPARLSRFARYRVANESYPGIIASEHDSVDGVLYQQIDSAAFRTLDQFEGEYYKRATVEITAENKIVLAETYTFHPNFEHLLTREPWYSDVFLERHLPDFLARYKGFDTGQ